MFGEVLYFIWVVELVLVLRMCCIWVYVYVLYIGMCNTCIRMWDECLYMCLYLYSLLD